MADQKNIAVMFIAGAAVVAVGASWGVYQLLNKYENDGKEQEEAAEVKTVKVVAARRTLYQGVSITNDDLFVVKIPPDFLPIVTPEEGDPLKAEVFTSRERVVGKVPRERILANEFVRPERLADGSSGIGLNAMIPPGMRAISLDLRNADAISGFLQPGNYVDVVVTMEDEAGVPYTETILQTVLVLGVNSKAQDEDDAAAANRGKQKPSTTFLVTQAQAEQLAFANEMGSVSLSLRSMLDSSYEQLDGASLDELLNRIKPIAEAPRRTVASRPRGEPAPVATGPTIDIIKGTVRNTVKVRTDQSAEPTAPMINGVSNDAKSGRSRSRGR